MTYNFQKLQYLLGCALFAVLIMAACWNVVQLPIWIHITDALISAIVFGCLGMLIDSILNYGNFEALTSYQRFINHIALAILTLLVWLGGNTGITYLFVGQNVTLQLVPTLVQKICIGIVTYIVFIQQIRLKMKADSAPNPETVNENAPELISTKATSEIIDRVSVKSGVKINVIMVSEIYSILSDGDYVQIVTEKSKFLKEQTMKYFEEHLPADKYIRVHRSAIVNIEMISHIELYEKQSQLLTLKNGQRIKVSPGGYKLLRNTLQL